MENDDNKYQKKTIELTFGQYTNFDDVMDIFTKYGDLNIQIIKGSFDNCECVIIKYDYEKDYNIVDKLLRNKEIKLKDDSIPYYRII